MSVFASKRVAVLLLGEPFRGGVSAMGDGRGDSLRGCNFTSMKAQGEATRSITQRVTMPLEEAGATVEVLLTHPGCASALQKAALSMLRQWLGPHRVVGERIGQSTGIGVRHMDSITQWVDPTCLDWVSH